MDTCYSAWWRRFGILQHSRECQLNVQCRLQLPQITSGECLLNVSVLDRPMGVTGVHRDALPLTCTALTRLGNASGKRYQVPLKLRSAYLVSLARNLDIQARTDFASIAEFCHRRQTFFQVSRIGLLFCYTVNLRAHWSSTTMSIRTHAKPHQLQDVELQLIKFVPLKPSYM